jgi:HAD superfamily hydrolase (TIGR01549 family)
METNLQAVFFDFGGTLFSYRSINLAFGDVIVEAGERLGSSRSKRELGRAYGIGSSKATKHYSDASYYRHADMMMDGYRGFARELGVTPTDEFIEWMYKAVRATMVEGFSLRDDCLSTLKALRERGLSVSIVSNIDDDFLLPMIERCGIGPYLDHYTSSEAAHSCKPDPGFFLHCAKLAKCEPERTLYVGDSPFHDVKGGQNVGMKTALIVEDGAVAPGSEGQEAPEPHYRIDALADLLEIVRS